MNLVGADGREDGAREGEEGWSTCTENRYHARSLAPVVNE